MSSGTSISIKSPTKVVSNATVSNTSSLLINKTVKKSTLNRKPVEEQIQSSHSIESLVTDAAVKRTIPIDDFNILNKKIHALESYSNMDVNGTPSRLNVPVEHEHDANVNFQLKKPIDEVDETKVDCVEGDHSHRDIQHDLQIVAVHTDISSYSPDQQAMFAASVHIEDPAEIEHPKSIQDVTKTQCAFPDELLPSLITKRRIIDMHKRKLIGETPKLSQRTRKSGQPNGHTDAARIQDFTRMNPPLFSGSKSEEDPQEFPDQVDRGTDAEPIEWEEFATAFLDKFFPLELREAKVLEFINLRQGNMTVKEYSLKFTQLARYAPYVVADSRSRMSKFIYGVSEGVIKECRTMMLIKEIDISRLMVYAQQIEEAKNKEREKENKRTRIGSFNFTQPNSEGGNRSYFCPNPWFQLHLQLVNNGRIHLLCGEYGKNHKGVCRAGSEVCYGCGKLGHRIRDCPQIGLQGQYSRSSAQSIRLNQQGTASSATNGQRPNRLYALQSRQGRKSSLDMVTGTLQIFHLS
ncbi:hypothetical protein FXO38_15181 [Capsicum annuum]|nr:hypothetical protein FXO38_15181 [Capsicum annuum]